MSKVDDKKTISKAELEVDKHFELKTSMLEDEKLAFVDHKQKLMMSPKNNSSERPKQGSSNKKFDVQMVVFDHEDTYDDHLR